MNSDDCIRYLMSEPGKYWLRTFRANCHYPIRYERASQVWEKNRTAIEKRFHDPVKPGMTSLKISKLLIEMRIYMKKD